MHDSFSGSIEVRRFGKIYLVVDAFIEEYTQGPPIRSSIVAFTSVDFGGEVSESSRLACEDLARNDVGGDILRVVELVEAELHREGCAGIMGRTKSVRWT